MALTKNEQVEECKKIFEGIPTLVNIKNKEGKRLERTPVLLTCNQVPWINFMDEAKPLKNRMFAYTHLRESDVLQSITKTADPRFYVRVFSFIKQELKTTSEWPILPEDDFWTLYQDRINDYLKDLLAARTMNLRNIVDEKLNTLLMDKKVSQKKWT